MSKLFFAWIFFLGTITSNLTASTAKPTYELSIAAIFRNEGPYLQEWIEYHRMAGVEHFWLYNDKSTDNWEEVLQPYIEEKIVEVIDWPIPGPAYFLEYQCSAYRNALKKTAGVTKWLALIDIDEFLLPAEEKTVTECLTKHFPGAAGVYVNWHNFGTGSVNLQEGESQLFRLTACSNKYHSNNSIGKSIVRPECTLPDDFWNIHHYPLKPDTYYYNGDAQQLSFSVIDPSKPHLVNLNLDGKVHNKFIRINHYVMRDEKFFHNRRLARASEKGLVWEHYHAFNKEQDTAIINFIREKHPEMYKKFWKSHVLTEPSYQLSIAAIFRNEGPFLQEWIEYHRMVGVEHFWLYNDKSTDNWEEVLRPYIAEKIVEVIDWPIPSMAHFIEFQRNAYRDALKKSAGVTKWLALIDIDEFLLPAEEKTVTECLAKHFPDAAGVYVNWHHFGTGGINLKEKESLLFRLTACSNNYHSNNSVGKSIVRPECTLPDDLWNIHHYPLKPDTYYYTGDAQKLSFTGVHLELDGKVHNKFIRLNHYTMRDEHFFHNTRLVRAKGIGIEEWLVWEHYHAFNKEQSTAIINFIREKHSEMYEKFWKPRVF